MSAEVVPSDWETVDPWWQTFPVVQSSVPARVLGMKRLTDCWGDLDPWWRAYTESSPAVQGSVPAGLLEMERLADCWDELDPWWDDYADTGHATAVELANLLDQSTKEWRKSDAPFDTDPLAADLTLNRLPHGPLQPTNEMGWSRWLARLLQPSAELVTELFDVEVDQSPKRVVREDQLSTHDEQDGAFRRPDILVFYIDCGVSIEVKLDDENYSKTAETAGLVERHYGDQEWTHALLLPRRKEERLGSIVEPQIEPQSDGQLQIEWDDPAPVSVIYWRDVTTAIRSLLRRNSIADDHWAANAYLFCAVVEQQIMGFKPQPIVKQLANPTEVTDTIRPIRIVDTLGEQLTYLRERMDHDG